MSAIIDKKRTWCLPDLDPTQVAAFAREIGVSEAIASVYLVRGLDTAQNVVDFTNPGMGVIHDPYLLPDMVPAVDRLVSAMENNECILIHGDADCDGITSTALLTHGFQALACDVICHVPNRLTDGFGLTVESVDHAKTAGVSLIVTVDCGTEAFAAAERCRELGIDLIITDHHEPRRDGDIPHCVACVNPKRRTSLYPFAGLSGAGVAFKAMQALGERLGCNQDDLCADYLPLVALGTIADCSSMLGENRWLVQQGLQRLNRSNIPGISELVKVSGVKVTDTSSVGFFISPIANATCRLGKPEVALQLLLESETFKARFIAHQLKELNEQRKALQFELMGRLELPEDISEHPLLFAAAEDLHLGLIGLVAGNIANNLGRPALVGSISGDRVKGSCRSVEGFDILAALDSCSDLLTRYGGHKMAAGFELPLNNLDALEERLVNYAESFGGIEQDCSLKIDAELQFFEITEKTHAAISALAPFGADNPEPLFYSPELVVVQAASFGKGGAHLKLVLSDGKGKSAVQAILWNEGFRKQEFPRGVLVDVVAKMGVDTYHGSGALMLTLEDVRHST